MTGDTGDAAEMLARLGPDGDFSDATSELGNLMRPLVMTKEAHHFYPLLFYFRFKEPLYAVSRFSFILLDLTTLIDTTLDRKKYSRFVDSAPVEALRRCSLLLLETLNQNFPTVEDPQTEKARSYEGSYAAALKTLRGAGVEAQPNLDSYADQRSRWEPLIHRVGPTLGYTMDEIDCRQRQHEPTDV